MIIDSKINKSFQGVFLIDSDKDGVKIAVTSKPNIFRRFFIKLFLGWKWSSIQEIKSK